MTVRSTLLAYGMTSAAQTGPIYQSPAGWRTILKDLWLQNRNTGTAIMEIVLRDPTQTITLDLYTATAAGGVVAHSSGWTVLNPGFYIVIATDSPNIVYWVSGTLLQLTGGEPV